MDHLEEFLSKINLHTYDNSKKSPETNNSSDEVEEDLFESFEETVEEDQVDYIESVPGFFEKKYEEKIEASTSGITNFEMPFSLKKYYNLLQELDLDLISQNKVPEIISEIFNLYDINYVNIVDADDEKLLETVRQYPIWTILSELLLLLLEKINMFPLTDEDINVFEIKNIFIIKSCVIEKSTKLLILKRFILEFINVMINISCIMKYGHKIQRCNEEDRVIIYHDFSQYQKNRLTRMLNFE